MRTIISALAFLFATTAIASAAVVDIQNGTGWQIDHVYISSASAEDWGYDRLGKEQVIAPGETWKFTFDAGGVCHWDLRVTFHDGTHRTIRNQDICAFDKPIWKILPE
jgi:hypothetical protein